MSLLSVSGLNIRFPTPQGDVRASNEISFGIREGEIFGLIGETGSGKSVIGQAILRLLPPSARVSGAIRFSGTDLLMCPEREMKQIRGRSIALIPQNPSGSLDPMMRCGLQVAEVFEEQHFGRQDALARTREVLGSLLFRDPVRVSEMFPHQISGGMRQRLTSGIALSLCPRMLIADEPTKGLDYTARNATIGLFRHIRAEYSAALLLITHDLDMARELCDRVAVLYAGEMVETGNTDQVFSWPEHPYTRGLLKASPRNGFVPIGGHSPSLTDLPSGCYFHDRCSVRKDRCATEHPCWNDRDSKRGVRCHLHCSGSKA